MFRCKRNPSLNYLENTTGGAEYRLFSAAFSHFLTNLLQIFQQKGGGPSGPSPKSAPDSDRVEVIVGSSSNSSELNDSGDQAAETQQLELNKKRYLSQVRLETDGKEYEYSQQIMCHRIIYM